MPGSESSTMVSRPDLDIDELRGAIACCKDCTPEVPGYTVRVHKGFLDNLVKAAERVVALAQAEAKARRG